MVVVLERRDLRERSEVPTQVKVDRRSLQSTEGMPPAADSGFHEILRSAAAIGRCAIARRVALRLGTRRRGSAYDAEGYAKDRDGGAREARSEKSRSDCSRGAMNA